MEYHKGVTTVTLGGAMVACVAFTVLFTVGAKGDDKPLQVPPSGVCIHEVVIWPNADSVGMAWTHAPCFDDVDLRDPIHSMSMRRSVLHLPGRCGLLYRLPTFPGPVVDTTSVSFACAE